MPKLARILAFAAACLVAACSTPRADNPRAVDAAGVSRPLPPSTSHTDPLPSAGASDSVGTGSASNAASGSSATRQSAPGLPR